MLSHILREAVLPPGCLLILLIVGLALRRRSPKVATGLLVGTTITLYLLSLPYVSLALSRWAESQPVAGPEQIAAFAPQAIVILGGGAEAAAPEYGGIAVPSLSSLQRVAYGAYLARQTGLPILVTGGYGATEQQSEAWAMKTALESNGIAPKWLETQGTNTFENAKFSQATLKADGIAKILLVTSASHAGRAATTFEKAGFQVLAAPTGYRRLGPWDRGLMLLVPTNEHFYESGRALRSQFSVLWYWLRGH